MEEDQGIWLGLISEDPAALMASAVFLVTPTVADYMGISLFLAHVQAPSGFNSLLRRHIRSVT